MRAFEPIDQAVAEARRHGLRLMVPLTENFDYYHGLPISTDEELHHLLSNRLTYLCRRQVRLPAPGRLQPDPGARRAQPARDEVYDNATVVSSFKAYVRVLMTHVNPYNQPHVRRTKQK